MLITFGVINLVVALAINPWRVDRIPERFPNIVQDTLVIALFALVATLILRDRVMATTAVGAVVIGLALQDTLGNLFAGLAIQIEKPFRVGDWVTIGGQDGLVSEITWRATKMRTKAGNFVVVPNSMLAKDTITNYCEPTRSLRLQVEVGASYEVPPNVVKAVIREALQSAPEILHERAPEVLLVDFGNSSIVYRVRFWVSDFEADERAKDLVRSLIYYAFKRNNITIPYPIQVEMSAEEGGVVPVRGAVGPTRLRRSRCSRRSRRKSARRCSRLRGRCSTPREKRLFVRARPARRCSSSFAARRRSRSPARNGEVARLRGGDVFGEMSLLTGEARTATVTAATDCDLLEIDAEGFRYGRHGEPFGPRACDERDGVAARRSSIATAKPTPPRRLADRDAAVPAEQGPAVPAFVESYRVS